MSCPADSGHFDELRGCVSSGEPVDGPLPAVWEMFFRSVHDIETQALGQSQVLPWLIEASDWHQIEVGVRQRARLLEEIVADVYGPQQLLAQGLLPAGLVFGQPGYLRAMHGVNAVGGAHLRVVAFDLTRQPDGRWCVLNQHCQVPTGWGYLLRNRARSVGLLPGAFEALPVRPLTGSFDALLRALQESCPLASDAPLAVLSPGHSGPGYAEQCWLARELGLTLLRPSELTVRDQSLYLKGLEGLMPVSVLIKCVDDEDLDPLELRVDSTVGVPGLLQATRAGKLLVANAPGSAFLEAPSLAVSLPALSRHLLGAELELSTVKPMAAEGPEQASQLPVWQAGIDFPEAQWLMHSATLRVFAWSDGNRSWHVLPGGLACFAGAPTQSGDVWVLGAESLSALGAVASPTCGPRKRLTLLSRRAAGQLFWLGRYSERCANAISLACLATECLAPGRPTSEALLAWLGSMAVQNLLLAADGTLPWLDRDTFDKVLRCRLEPGPQGGCIADKLRALSAAAADVLEHLPAQHDRAVERAQAALLSSGGQTEPGLGARQTRVTWLRAAGLEVAAIMALQTGDQVQEEVRRLVGIGHSVERLGFRAAALRSGLLCGTLQTVDGLDALSGLFNGGAMACSGPSANQPALLFALLTGNAEAHSLVVSAQSLRLRLIGQHADGQDSLSRLAWRVPDPFNWALKADPVAQLDELLLQCQADTLELSNAICSVCADHPTELPSSD